MLAMSFKNGGSDSFLPNLDFKELSIKFIKSQKLYAKIVGAVVGGSYARGEVLPNSDVDLMLVIRDKYRNHYSQIHSSLEKFSGKHFSIIYQSERSLKDYLENPDPSIISFLRDGIVIIDSQNKLLKIKERVSKIKVYKSLKDMEESKRRLNERLEENIRRIEDQIKTKDYVLGTYLLKNVLDETIEKLRMYEEDWLYSQKKSNLKFLKQNKHKHLRKLFLEINKPLSKNQLERYIKSLENLVEKIDITDSRAR